MNSSRWSIATVALFGLVCASGARAGLKGSYPVKITATGAYGAVGSARASADNTQYLYCAVEYNSYYNSTKDRYMRCVARDASGTTKACSSYNPELINAVANVSSVSYIQFERDDQMYCTYLYLEQGSPELPSAP